MEPFQLTASEAARQIAQGALSSERLVKSLAERIEARDLAVKAWINADIEGAVRTARKLDQLTPTCPLHGIPFGVKDVFDTAEMPTTYNSAAFFDHRPTRDASCVSIARKKGAILLGKTDTVEFAAGGRRAVTRHPENPNHTPGGSSSGSAAAVADFQVPWAIGTQTGGSLIRPASFCGVYAFKPTLGTVGRDGLRYFSNLDAVGWYGRSAADLSLIAQAYGLAEPRPPEVPLDKALTVGICRSPFWDRITADGNKAFEEAVRRLEKANVRLVDFDLPSPFEALAVAQDNIMRGESKAAFYDLYLELGEALHDDFRAMYTKGGVSSSQMLEAYDLADESRPRFSRLLKERGVDLLLTPAATGEAPKGLSNTGDPIFNVMWSVLHVPCVAMPCSRGINNLPIGVQLVSGRFADSSLLRQSTALARLIDIEALRLPIS